MSVSVARRHFNVTDYYRMVDAGILLATDRVELLNGEVIEMSPIGSQHAACVDRLNRLLKDPSGVIVRVQSPIRLNNSSEPQPDICLLRARDDFYSKSHPTPADILLLIEVADSSLESDRAVKLPLYADALIPEVWLVDLSNECIEIFWQPAKGKYQKTVSCRRGEQIRSAVLPDLIVGVEEVLG